MSTSRSISLEGPVLVKRIGPAKMLMMAGGLVLAAAVGYALNSPETKQASAARVVSQAQTADFLYWNTTALGRAIPAASVVGSTVDPFIEANTTALERPAPAASVAGLPVDPFLHINIEALEGLVAGTRGGGVGSSDDRFLEWNMGALEYSRPQYPEQWRGPR